MPSDTAEHVTFDTMKMAIEMLAPFHVNGRAFVYLPEAQPEGPDHLHIVLADDPRVLHFLTLAHNDVYEKPPKNRAALRPWIDLLHGMAGRNPGEPSMSAKEKVLLRVATSYARAVRNIKKEPQAMHTALAAHAKRFGLLQPGDELPASEDALTPMLNAIKKRLAERGVVVESDHKGRRFITIRLANHAVQGAEATTPDTSTALDTSGGPEVCDATAVVADRSVAEDTSATETVLASLRDRRKE